MKIDIWSDIACPWCTVGRQNLKRALADFDGEVEIRWRSFELDPGAAPVKTGDYATLLAAKYSMPVAKAQGWLQDMRDRGEPMGLSFDFDALQAGNTFLAHQLLHFASKHDLQDAMKARLFDAYFAEGRLMSDLETLVELAAEVGLEADTVREVLTDERYGPEVRSDEQLASQLGIRGVPFFVIDQKYALNGAQPPEVLLQALTQAVAEADASEPVGEAEACGPDGCAV